MGLPSRFLGAVERPPHRSHITEKESNQMLNRRNAIKITAAFAAAHAVPTMHDPAQTAAAGDPLAVILSALSELTMEQLMHVHFATAGLELDMDRVQVPAAMTLAAASAAGLLPATAIADRWEDARDFAPGHVARSTHRREAAIAQRAA
jgi:hypothetical protein